MNRRAKIPGEVPWHLFQTKNPKQQSLQKPHPHLVSLPNVAVAKQALKKPLPHGKQAPQKTSQGKTQQNRKCTDFYPVQRSSRKSKAELQSEERKKIDELIENGKEEGTKIVLIDGKGGGGGVRSLPSSSPGETSW
jgi:histone-lysine N-methyltransferase SETD8